MIPKLAQDIALVQSGSASSLFPRNELDLFFFYHKLGIPDLVLE